LATNNTNTTQAHQKDGHHTKKYLRDQFTLSQSTGLYPKTGGKASKACTQLSAKVSAIL
jgi:hypothetical protein